ncbi:hypothetical protein [Oceanobacillus neutriphilus]|uniref:Uncharacterized protein n=1 Tax=Oceanobacillus neutriphilus TaxID=531815 RepID=A0ABQ2NZ75_9BACI|nr:hypothetical protein [Oceanobacillus neutriphilus]GGP14220.1 hypothetical protein GCM10011346_37480 [Oceanobacillus neutriphilus]
MNKYYVMYNSTDVIWCWEEEAFEKITMGWKLYAVANDEETADAFCEEACYI